MTPTLVERGTKPFIIVSLIGVGAMTVTTAIDWPLLPWVSVAALVGSNLAARRFRETIVGGWLLITYLAPALARLGLDDFRLWDLTPWIAGLIGAMTANVDPTRWHLPARWRAPLVGWGLVVAASWPIVWLRELDFAPSVLSVANVANNGAGVPAGIALLWVYGVVTVHLLGLLLLDWLFATFGQSDRARFQRVVLMPLALSWIGAWLVGLYQSVVDPAFLNPGFWAAMGRASGTLMDANPFGMIAALWGAIGVALVLGRPPSATGGSSPTARLALAVLVLVASWYGLWVSGSRSALGAGAVVLVFALWQLRGLTARVPRGRLAGVGVAGALLVGAVWIVAGSSSLIVGPWERLAQPRPSASVREVAIELWDRNGYGATATRMIADSPLVGVGVGSFHLLVPDAAYQLGRGRIAGDNAQNWFRHQIAEFGLIGSLGWILWVALFLRLLATGRPVDGGAVPAGLVRGALIALGLASLVGMPTVNVAVAVTFSALVFWYAVLVKPPAEPAPSWCASRRTWTAVWLLALVYAGGLAYVSWVDLRVPYRAQRADWDYSYGFYDAEAAGTADEFRWASSRALAVVPLTDRWIEVTAWTHHPDLRDRPVNLEVWIDGELLIDSIRESGEPITSAVRIPEGRLRVVVETRVDRTWRPSDRAEADTRELGPGVRWRFIDP